MKKWLVLLTLLVSSVFCFAEEEKITTIEKTISSKWGEVSKYNLTYKKGLEGLSYTRKRFNKQYIGFITDSRYKKVSEVNIFPTEELNLHIKNYRNPYRQAYNDMLHLALEYGYCVVEIYENNQLTKRVVAAYVSEEGNVVNDFYTFEVEE